MNLIIEYFESENPVRKSEYIQTLYQNISNDLIERIFIFISDDSELKVSSPKVKIVREEKRPTYRRFFEFCNETLDGEICVLSNADIVFDHTLKHVNDIDMNGVFLALTRWENVIGRGKVPFNNGSSQDSWIFKAPVKTTEEMEFTLGRPGCDNRIALLMRDVGYTMKNPGNQIVGLHNHTSRYRTYTKDETVEGPYLGLVPNDNITSETQSYEIDGFDEQGRPYLL